MKITIECNENHARIIQQALDLYSRLGMGQFDRIHELMTFDFAKKLDVRSEAEEILDNLKALYFPELGKGYGYHGIFSNNTPDQSKVAWDIIQVIRNKIAWHEKPEGGHTVSFGDPMKSGSEKFIKVKVED